MLFIVKNAMVNKRITVRFLKRILCDGTHTASALSVNQGRLKEARERLFFVGASAHLSLHVECRKPGTSQNRFRGILLCLSRQDVINFNRTLFWGVGGFCF